MSEETNFEEKQLSPEQLAELKKQQLAFYEDNTPLLESQVKFEELKARLEKARLEQLQARLQRIHIEISMQEKEDDSEPEKED